MIKIAAIFSGQPRTVTESYQNLKENLFRDEYDVKYFGHIWSMDDEYIDFMGRDTKVHYEQLDKCLELYPFEKVELEKQMLFKHMWSDKEGVSGFPNSYPMNYTRQRASQIFRDYVDNTGEKFDFVLNMRFDLYLLNKVYFEFLTKNLVYVSEMHWANSDVFDDTWGVWPQDVYMYAYNDLFDFYCGINANQKRITNSERYFTEHLRRKGILNLVNRNKMIDFAFTSFNRHTSFLPKQS